MDTTKQTIYTSMAISAEKLHASMVGKYMDQEKIFKEEAKQRKLEIDKNLASHEYYKNKEKRILMELDDALHHTADKSREARHLSNCITIASSDDPEEEYRSLLYEYEVEPSSNDEKRLFGSYRDCLELGTILLRSRD